MSDEIPLPQSAPRPAPGLEEPNPWYGRRPPPKQMLCQARRVDGEPCQSFAMLDGFCRQHGPNGSRGKKAPPHKGRYGRCLPANLRDKYVELIGDEDLLSLSDEIATQTSMIMEQMQALEKTPEPPWEALR